MSQVFPLLALTWGLLTACSAKDEAAAPVQPGRAYFKQSNCRVCHRVGPEGGRGGPDLSMVGVRHNKEWLDRFLQDPKAWRKATMMPNAKLSGEARRELVDYLMTLRGQAWADAPPWADPDLAKDPVKKGHMVYGRAGCIACHGKAGIGGYPNDNVPGGLIPALSGVSQTFTKAELKKKILAGSKPVKKDPKGPTPSVSMPAWGGVLGADAIDAVVEYLFSLKSGAAVPSDW